MKSGLNYTGYPEAPADALEVLEILMRAYVPKNTTDANYCLAALNVLRRQVAPALSLREELERIPPIGESK